MQYQSIWRTAEGHLHHARLVPYGWDGAAYLTLEHAAPDARRFTIVSQQRIEGEDCDRRSIEAYIAWAARMRIDATPLYLEDALAPQPPDYVHARAMQADELALCDAMLHIELEQYDDAAAALQRATEAGKPLSFYALTVARRLAVNHADQLTESGDETAATASRALAIDAAEQFIARYREALAADPHAAMREPFYFGDDYKKLAMQLCAACQTQAEYRLAHASPAEALEVARLGIDTNYAYGELIRCAILALLALDRMQEAVELHARHRHQIEPVPAVADSALYRQHLEQQADAAARQEEQRRQSMDWQYLDGPPFTEAQIADLIRDYGALPAEYPAWVRSGKRMGLQIGDRAGNEHYRCFDSTEVRERHASLHQWIHLHDANTDYPELAREIHAALRESGIEPSRMLPIVGNAHSADMFLLRLDGSAGERGAVYLWSHDEPSVFEVFAPNCERLFDALIEHARAHGVFYL